jgi:hypothetical protein
MKETNAPFRLLCTNLRMAIRLPCLQLSG